MDVALFRRGSSERARVWSTFVHGKRLVVIYDDGSRIRFTLLPVWTVVSFAAYCVLTTLLLMRLSDECLCWAHSYYWASLILILIYFLSTRSYRVLYRCTIISSTFDLLPTTRSIVSISEMFKMIDLDTIFKADDFGWRVDNKTLDKITI